MKSFNLNTNYKQILADTITPVSVYFKIRDKFSNSLLLESSDYSEVSIFVRRPTGKSHSKLTEHVVDFSDVNSFQQLITGDVLFSCLGTTLKDEGSKEKQWKIDYDIPADFATAAKQNNVNSLVLVSSYGASAKSSVFYSKMKGELEEKIASFLLCF